MAIEPGEASPSHEALVSREGGGGVSWFKRLFGSDESSTPPPSLAGEHVLLVDPSVVIQRVVELTLQDQGCRLTVVGSADEAVTALATTQLTVMIVAAEILATSGHALLGAAARRTGSEGTTVIVAKGVAEHLDEGVLRRIGPEAVLAKPFQPAELLDRIRRARQGRR